MKKHEAIKRAKELSRKNNYDYFVVNEPDEGKSNYQPVREDQLDTWFYGCLVYACVEPNGQVHE